MIVFPLPLGPLVGVGTLGGWRVSSYFGGRLDPITGVPSRHGGMDLVAPTGTPIYAPAAGWCSQAWDATGGGNWTSIACADGSRWGLGHATRFEPGVNGTEVRAGQLVAYVGSTGHSTGAHLHVAYDSADPGGAYEDPYDLLAEAAAAGRFGGQPTPPLPPKDWLDMATIEEVRQVVREELAVFAKQLDAAVVGPLTAVLDQLDPRRNGVDPVIPARDLLERLVNKTGA